MEPVPSGLVTPAHTVVCLDPSAMEEVEGAKHSDLARGHRPPPSEEITEDDE
jgi:hypothetical protein